MTTPNWRVGQTYKMRDGTEAKLLHILNNSGLPLVFVYSMPNGTEMVGTRDINGVLRTFSPSNRDVLPPEEATLEEREWVARIREIFGHSASEARNPAKDILNEAVYPMSYKLIQIVREIRK